MYTVTPCAKINLGLNITEKRPDGYHNLETVFYPVPLFDRITIRENGTPEGTCSLSMEGIEIEGNPEENLVVKAYREMCRIKPLPGVEISLRKNIPTQAGMGGGSADCAYTLTALNSMFGMGLPASRMEEIAARLGADCAFFVKSEPCFATGIGDMMQTQSRQVLDSRGEASNQRQHQRGFLRDKATEAATLLPRNHRRRTGGEMARTSPQ